MFGRAVGSYRRNVSNPAQNCRPQPVIVNQSEFRIRGVFSVTLAAYPRETVGFGVSDNAAAAADYPFQITGTADIVSHTINAILRVGDFTASIDKTTATLTAGQSATFNVTLTSVNHYSNSITVVCQPPVMTLNCAVSPTTATLSDGSTAMVQVTLKDASTIAGIHGHRPITLGGYFLSLLVPLSLLFVRLKRQSFTITLLMVVLAGTISCGGAGGGGNGGGNGGTGGSGGGTPQTVSIPVFALAATSQSDQNNFRGDFSFCDRPQGMRISLKTNWRKRVRVERTDDIRDAVTVLKITRWVLIGSENSLLYSILCPLSRKRDLTGFASF